MQFEPCCPDGVLNVRRRAHGEKCAADRDSSQPTGHTSCPLCLFASLPLSEKAPLPLLLPVQPFVDFFHSSLIGICWGHFSSHFAHSMHADALCSGFMNLLYRSAAMPSSLWGKTKESL